MMPFASTARSIYMLSICINCNGVNLDEEIPYISSFLHHGIYVLVFGFN